MLTRGRKILELARSSFFTADGPKQRHLSSIRKYESTEDTATKQPTATETLLNDKFKDSSYIDQSINGCTRTDEDIREEIDCSRKEETSEHVGSYEQNEINTDFSETQQKEETKQKRININEENRETLNKEILKNTLMDCNKQFEEKICSSDELFESSGSEYIPDTSDCETDEEEILSGFREGRESIDNMTNNFSTDAQVSTSENYRNATINEAGGDNLKSRNIIEKDGVSFSQFLQSSSSEVEQFSNSRPWTKKNSCPYCFKDVTHFPRHLQRNHQDIGAVKQLLTLSIKDPNRKCLLNAIRRQGNYMLTTSTKQIRPIRRPKSYCLDNNNLQNGNLENLKEKYIVCQDCLGYFKRNYLRRHRKICALKPKAGEQGNREQHLSAAQLFTICSGVRSNFYSNLRLKREVFPIMRNDEISKTAMNDVLVCCYAESLLRKHKRTQIKNVISNKMREVGRLLLILKEVTGVNELFNLLRPQFFDNFVSATRIISGYDEESHTFKASSLALHMGTTLKQVCDIGTKMIIQKNPLLSYENCEDRLKEIKRLRNLIQNHWNSEICSLALKNLNEKSYEKPKLLPLTQNIVKFQQFVLQEAKEACKALQENLQLKRNYRRLSECVLSLTVLLNRKRIGEIQYLKTDTYQKVTPQNQQQELLQVLSDAEKTLTTKFKRVVTEGKGSKPVAILFPTNVQEFIEVLLSVRNSCVPDGNKYLFANPDSRNGWLNGYHTLKKLAEESGVSDKNLFTSTRLRKQIATVLQVMNLTEGEMEQLAKFMGHTLKTHESFYRLPQDVYQTAKVSKLLMAINSGKGSLYKGKTLDEIDVGDAEVDEFHSKDKYVEDTTKNDEVMPLLEDDLPLSDLNASPHLDTNEISSTRSIKKNNEKIRRIRWTEEQKKLVLQYFKEFIKKKKAPRKHDAEAFISKYRSIFKERNWVQVKAFVYNCYK